MDPTRAVASGPGDGSRASVGGAVSVAAKRPKIAPMMAKTLKLARGLNRGGGFRR